MDLGSYLHFWRLDLLGMASWAFALAMVAKIVSTAVGLRLRAAGATPRQVPAALWWTSKLSAIAVCWAAALLCQLARDDTGRMLFSGLGVAAMALVAVLLARRLARPK